MSNPTLYKKNLLKDRTTWIILLIVILCLLCRLVPGPRIIDDSYITYRYVRNIINGIGFSYNPGEHVLGTTTPFYTFLLTLVSFLFNRNHLNNLPVDALAINAIADSLTCIVLWRMGKHLGSERVGLITAALWSIAPFSVTFAIGGLETSVYVFWLVFTCFMYYNYHLHYHHQEVNFMANYHLMFIY